MFTKAGKMAETVKSRLLALAETLLDDNETIPAVYRPVVKKLMSNYLGKADPAQVSELLTRVRDEIIPFILTGAIPNDGHTDSQ
jgi:hypothetical protein